MFSREIVLAQRAGKSLAVLEKMIGQHRVISFDVFDTLLCRRVWKPVDLFCLLEVRHEQPGFAAAREKAEWLARRRFRTDSGSEVTLKQIYIILAEMIRGLKVTAEMELQAEADCLFGDPATALLVEAARRQGKRVIGISDMYLPGTWISGILEREGIGLDALYCSSDHQEVGLGKFDGTMFAYAALEEGVAMADILHFGDNSQADVANANKAGVTGFHIRSRRDYLEAARRPFIPLATSNLTGSLMVAQIARKMPFAAADEPPIYSYGYAMGGPLLLGFCLHLIECARRDKVERLNLLARDGYIIEKALEILKPVGLSWGVMPMSRRMAIFPMLVDAPDLVEYHLFRELKGEQTPRFFWRCLGLDDEDLGEHPAVDRPMNSKAFVKIFASELAAAASAERGALKRHLDDWIGDRVCSTALVDVGWGLSTFRALDKLVDSRFPGYFVGIRKKGYYREGLSGYLFDHGSPEEVEEQLAPGLDLIELVFSDCSPGFSRVVLRDGAAEPERMAPAREDILRNADIEEVRRGALDFVRDITPVAERLDAQEACVFLRETFARVISGPSPEEHAALSDVPHARTAGHGDWATIGNYWRPSLRLVPSAGMLPAQSHAHALTTSRAVQLVKIYEDLVPIEIRKLAENRNLPKMDWRKQLWIKPLKVSRWRAVRRYQRRLEERANGKPKEMSN